jgi:hypothetical protein
MEGCNHCMGHCIVMEHTILVPCQDVSEISHGTDHVDDDRYTD